MPAEYVETITVPASTLTEYPGNPKRHDTDALLESLTGNGQYRSVIARRLPDGTLQLLAGHGTTAAADELARPVRVEVITCDDDEARRIVLADNAIGPRGGYDTDALLALLDQANAHGGLTATGYDEDLYRELLDRVGSENPYDWAPADGVDPDDHDTEPPEEPLTGPGDVWELGRHRLVCGDATAPRMWDRLLGDDQVHAVWTDPPYGVAYEGSSGRAAQTGAGDRDPIENDALTPAQLLELLRSALGHAYQRCRPGGAWYVAAPGMAEPMLAFATVLGELKVARQVLVWVKDSFVFGRSDYHGRFEPIFYGWKPGAAHHAVEDRTQDTVWEIPRPRRSDEHPTMKPLALVERALNNSTHRGDLIADMFGGSGTTLLACEALDRVARLIELDPAYCDVIARRWQQTTGGTPLLNGEPVDLLTPSEPAGTT